MTRRTKALSTPHTAKTAFTWGDAIAVSIVLSLIYFGARLAIQAPVIIEGPEITLNPHALPWYTLLSVGRMAAAYLLSLVFTLFYGRYAAYNQSAEKILIPLLDVLQSVPILSFLPVVLLSLSAILPENIAVELASIVLIFTSQAWNLTFAWYQSLTTIPKEYHEASKIFRLNTWMKFRYLELPFGMISLVWNSMMSWAGGWFFLMAAEIFTVGSKDFRLPGLGAYLHEAANQNQMSAIIYGVIALVLTVIILDQLVWRPLIAWSDRFKVEMVVNDNPPTSWFYSLTQRMSFLQNVNYRFFEPLRERISRWIIQKYPMKQGFDSDKKAFDWKKGLFMLIFGCLCLFCLYQSIGMLKALTWLNWSRILLAVLLTLLRVIVALLLAFLWTIPVGVAIGTNQKLASILQPVVQVVASVPATALFPVLLLIVLNLKGGLDIAAILLMLMGTQWYLLFNIIAGVSAIPKDLLNTTRLLHIHGWQRWESLLLPAIFPYLVTGAITASGGAWNASIVAEYQNFNGKTLSTFGIGSIIAESTAVGDYPMLLAATFAMILAVIVINRLVWRRLYQLAEDKYRME